MRSPNDMDNPELDAPEYCLICGKEPDHTCQCPECPVCETVGDPDCLGTHVGHPPQRYTWEVVYDIPGACDSLGVFDSPEEARAFGEIWLADCRAHDHDPEAFDEDVSYEVLEPEEAPPTPEDVAKVFASPYVWETFTKRTNEPKLRWLERQLELSSIPSRRGPRPSAHAPILEVPAQHLDAAWEILGPVDDIPDDDERWL